MSHEMLAGGFLLLVASSPLICGVIWVNRSPFGYVQAFLLLVATLLVRLRWRAQVPPLPLGKTGGAILVCNHRSSVDPFFIQVAAGRLVHWMVAREYCESAAFGWFLRLAQVIPVNRNGIDTAATKMAIRLAAAGELVGMFPEGRINMTNELLLPGRPGAILVALKAQVPILPVYIEGAPYRRTPASPFFMKARVRVRFGEKIDPAPGAQREGDDSAAGEVLLRVLSAIARLAGRPDFQPRLAGRRWKPTQAEIERDAATADANRQQGLS